MSLFGMKVVGLIGAGLLGSAMAERVLAQGWAVIGFERDQEAGERLRGAGGTIASSNAEVAEQSERIVLSLPHSGVSGEVLREIGAHLKRGALVIDTTTGSPEEMAAFGGELAV